MEKYGHKGFIIIALQYISLHTYAQRETEGGREREERREKTYQDLQAGWFILVEAQHSEAAGIGMLVHREESIRLLGR